MPNDNHQTDKLVKPKILFELAKGVPLSDWITLGKPNFLNKYSNYKMFEVGEIINGNKKVVLK